MYVVHTNAEFIVSQRHVIIFKRYFIENIFHQNLSNGLVDIYHYREALLLNIYKNSYFGLIWTVLFLTGGCIVFVLPLSGLVKLSIKSSWP